MAGGPTQTAQHGTFWMHLWHVPGIAECDPMVCMTMSEAWASLRMLSIDNADWLVLTTRLSASTTERRARILCIEQQYRAVKRRCQLQGKPMGIGAPGAHRASARTGANLRADTCQAAQERRGLTSHLNNTNPGGYFSWSMHTRGASN